MFRRPSLKFVLSVVTFFAINNSTVVVFPQDLVASDDVSGGGASVFVFRKSSKAPHEKAAGRPMRSDAASGRAGRTRFEGQVATNRRKRTAPAKSTQPQVARNRPAARPSKAVTAQTLAAKGDSLLDTKQTDQAMAAYRDALKNDPRNADAKAA